MFLMSPLCNIPSLGGAWGGLHHPLMEPPKSPDTMGSTNGAPRHTRNRDVQLAFVGVAGKPAFLNALFLLKEFEDGPKAREGKDPQHCRQISIANE